MSFDEANTVRDGLRDHLKRNGWTYIPATALPRSEGDVLVEPYLKTALIRLNPEIAHQPDRADEVIYRLRAILLTVQGRDSCGPKNASPRSSAAASPCPSARTTAMSR